MTLTEQELRLLLESACLRGDSARARELLEAGAGFDFMYERPPGVEAEKKLMAKSSHPKKGGSLNMDYVLRISPEALSELLAMGLDPHRETENLLLPVGYLVWSFTPSLTEAERAEDERQLGELLRRIEAFAKAGASMEAPRPGGRSPLMDAAGWGGMTGAPLTRCLLRWGADPNAIGPGKETALHAACRLGQIEAMKALIEDGADERAKDELNRSPRDWALSGPLRGAFLAAVEERDLKAALPEAKKSATPRM